MFVNVWLGFCLPWLIGIYILRDDRSLIYTIGPAASFIAFAFNEIGYFRQWWQVTPEQFGVLSFLPYNLGVFPVLGCLCVFSARKSKLNIFLLLILFSLLKTGLEMILVLFGKVSYGHGWNAFWTFFSYLIACSLTYGMYRLLRRA